MAGKREKPEDIVSKLRQVEVLQGQGTTVAEAVRQIRRFGRIPWTCGSRRSVDPTFALCSPFWRTLIQVASFPMSFRE